MQRIYDIDRIVTGPLKSFSNKLTRFGLTIEFQFSMLPAIMMTIIILQMVDTSGTSALGLLYVPAAWAICYCLYHCVKRFLKRLHLALDYEGATTPNKYYSSGYAAWSATFITLALYLLSVVMYDPHLYNGVIAAEGMTGLYAVMFFLNRIENTQWKKRKRKVEETQTTELLAPVLS